MSKIGVHFEGLDCVRAFGFLCAGHRHEPSWKFARLSLIGLLAS
ncbi:hypothetical protein LMG24235_08683 [Paraburkholderia sabiae]|nr:hypothetical protein LMG24235_08683 [Paraburkholderia sabiae]